ncbi:MAG: leucine-rich repeat domain-containing protein [Ruminococcaceae bacterium]|nr:leucine-rich repeat domain-containing protein [Oscillospiraceae bacterium]
MSKAQSRTEYSRYYNSFLGLNLSENPSSISEMRLSDMENMYRDYYGNDGAALETVPGYRKIYSFSDGESIRKINAIFHYTPQNEATTYVLVHAGKRLYRFPLNRRNTYFEPLLIPLLSADNEIKSEEPLRDEKSMFFEFGGKVYILDGEDYFVLDGTSLKSVKDIAYIPTTYSDGEAYEQKNLLSDSFSCVYHLSKNLDGLTKYTEETTGLVYRITGEDTCCVEGLEATQTNIYIPSCTEIDGRTYYIDSIAPYAFSKNTSMKEIKMADGIKKIGYGAFYSCTSLKKAYLPASLEELGRGTFMYCSSLSEVCIGYKISTVPLYCFYDTSLSKVNYMGTTEQWSAITVEGSNIPLKECENISYGYRERSGSFIFYINEKCKSLSSVMLDGALLNENSSDLSYTAKSEKGLISAIIISTTDYGKICGKTLTVSGLSPASDNTGICKEFPNYKGGAYGIIARCTVSAIFDGRIFFSGNPEFPACVFYSSKDTNGLNLPEYVGALNYFTVGRTDSRISYLLASGENLIVFKEDSEKGGVYIHYPSDTAYDLVPRIYPCAYSISGVGALGRAYNFYDDTVFLSDRGLDALSKRYLNAEHHIEHRSSNIDLALLQSKPEKALICRWLGYLCIALGEDIFLADSRRTFRHASGDLQYEWYRLKGIGTYLGQYTKYFYSPLPSELTNMCVLFEEMYLPIEEKTWGELSDSREVLSSYCYEDKEDRYEMKNKAVYYTVEHDEEGLAHCYICDSEGEMTGGSFYPICEMRNINEILFFGTECGDLCCFNTDMRDETGNIDSKYYAFDNRRYTSSLTSSSDNCSIPHLTKTTVKRSLCAHLKTFGSGKIKIGVRTDRVGWKDIDHPQNNVFGFDDVEFDSFSFETSQRINIPLSEKEKRWTEKQYRIFSDEYKRPFGIFSMSYRYRVAGRIKE